MALHVRRFGASTTVLAIALLACAMPAAAQDAAPADDEASESAPDIVVTAQPRGRNRLETSVSVSSLSADQILEAAPRSAAEILRALPGIRSESSGGEGNANIAVRGLPVASGGAKFLQLQEDGLPILEFGDITFANADIFLRSDFNVARVETVRGGSASTFASNSPGGVVNFISKTGAVEGGAIQVSAGLDYDEYRVDFDYGTRLSDNLLVHIGGFYRQGEGPRDIGYDGLQGGQVRVNITREFEGGYIRLYGKYLNDNAVGYLPNPVLVTGSASNPDYSNVPGFDINEDSLHSRYFVTATTLDGENNVGRYDVRDGMHPVVKSVGFEAQFDILDGWQLTNRFRYSNISGGFTSPFPGSVGTASSVATGIGGAGATAVFANGPNAGQALAANALVAQVVLFNTRLNSLDNVTNDIRLNRSFDIGSGTADFSIGFYKSRQEIDTSWLWTAHLLEVRGGGDAALVNVRNAAGATVTDGGTVGYGATFFGNCCRRVYDLAYDTNAPFASLSFDFDKLTIDGSIRFDFGSAEGAVFGSDLGGGRVGLTSRDIDGNGTISVPESQTSVVPLGQPGLVNYDYDYVSYSLGVNYRLADDLSIFGRYSRGGRANADRILFNSNNVRNSDGALLNNAVAVDFVDQAEVGLKYQSSGIQLYATGFYATTEEENFEATTQRLFSRGYEAYGIELEGVYRVGGFSISGGATWTHAEITDDNISPANVGNRPRRQAEFIYQLAPRYETEQFTIGAQLIGTTDSYAQDNNDLVLPGFAQVNAFVAFRPLERVELSLNANNLFNTVGITEAEEGSIPGNGIVRARSINGRTVAAAVRFEF
jgi:outer membrane receptor protein involved in Fe transport